MGNMVQRADGRKKRFVMQGGPYNGMTLMLRHNGTLPICVRGEKGHYNSDNVWVPYCTVGTQ